MPSLSLSSLLSADTGPDLVDAHTESPTLVSYERRSNFYNSLLLITDIFMFIVSCFGIVSNGAVIWILGFGTQVYPFTIYVLNLAITDVGILIARAASSLVLIVTKVPTSLDSAYFEFFLFMCIIDLLLLAAIGVDRGLSVVFPVWHQYRLPAYLPIIVCIVIWTFSFLFSAFHFMNFSPGTGAGALVALYPFVMTSLICLPLMTISSVVLLAGVCFKTHDYQRATLLMVVAITLLLSILFFFPLNIISMIRLTEPIYHTVELGSLAACLGSSIKPLVYFLAGRKKVAHCQRSIRAALQMVFEEGRDYGQEIELEVAVQT